MRTSWHELGRRPAGFATGALLVLDVVIVVRAERTRVAGGAG
jgi:hypothetical protein